MKLSQAFYDEQTQKILTNLQEATEAFYRLSKDDYWRRSKKYTETPIFEEIFRLSSDLAMLIHYVKRSR